MIDIVYILGNGSKWNNNEIKYSLRSVEKHLKNYRNIYIVGECPNFLTNVIHIPCNDIGERHEQNIMEKIKVACTHKDISNDFLFINDDHFFVKDTNALQYPYYYKGTLLDGILKRKSDAYQEALINTLNSVKQPKLNFDTHTPIIYNKYKFLGTMKQFDWENNDYVIKSLYCNTLGVKGVFDFDCKIERKLTYEQIVNKVKDRHVFSIGDKALIEGVAHYDKNKLKIFFKNNYSNKSKYERTSETDEVIKS